jgi:hypothetical protein
MGKRLSSKERMLAAMTYGGLDYIPASFMIFYNLFERCSSQEELGLGGGFVLSPVENMWENTDKTWENIYTFIDAWKRHQCKFKEVEHMGLFIVTLSGATTAVFGPGYKIRKHYGFSIIHLSFLFSVSIILFALIYILIYGHPFYSKASLIIGAPIGDCC